MKAALLTLDYEALQALLPLPAPLTIQAAHMDYGVYGRPALQLVVTGDTLPDAFQLTDGDRVREAALVVEFPASGRTPVAYVRPVGYDGYD